MSDWKEAAKRRGVPRIAWLCSDDNPDPDDREQWRAHVVGQANGDVPPAPDRPAVAEALRLVMAAKQCPYRSLDSACGCSGALCGLRPPARRRVALPECFLCIQRYGSG